MNKYAVDRVATDGAGQSWDVLGDGDTFGRLQFDSPEWDQIWRWPNFKPRELMSKSDGVLMLYLPAIDALQEIRSTLDRPLVVTSAYRSPQHNRKIGGSKRSRHLAGAAFDVAMGQNGRAEFVKLAKAKGFNGFGYYPSFVHVDFRSRPAAWRGK